MKTETFTAETCLNIPEEIAPGVIHVSRQMRVAVFLCPCGCGRKAVLEIGETHRRGNWTFDEKAVTFSPSINDLVCRAHYWIRNGKVVWA